MKKSNLYPILVPALLLLIATSAVGQSGYAINFQNSTFVSHGDFISCGAPSYGFTNQLTVTAWIKWTTSPQNWAVTNHGEREGYYSTYIAYATHNTVDVSSEEGLFWLRNAKVGNKIEFTVQKRPAQRPQCHPR